MNKLKKVIIVVLFIAIIPTLVLAHSGKTDGNGGHWDYSTGTYHYHNGGSSSTIHYNFTDTSDDEYVSNLEKKNANLEDKVSNLQEKIDSYEYDLEKTGFNSFMELNNKLKETEATISNMWSLFIFVSIAIMIIFYNIGFKASDNNKPQQIKQITDETQKLKDYKSTIIALIIVLSFMVIAIIGLLIYISELK